jgi:DNA-binding GntR family transcriptional regulator
VTRIDLVDCKEAMFIRRALESDAAREIASRSDEALIATLTAILKDQRKAMSADDRIRFHDCDVALHDALLSSLGYERVKSAVLAARAKLDRMRLFLCTPQRQAATLAEHRRIVDALLKHDPAQAGAAMEAHLDMVMEELNAFAAVRPEAFATGDEGAEAA